MAEISTQKQSMTKTTALAAEKRQARPRLQTIAILKQFARSYYPANTPMAIILN